MKPGAEVIKLISCSTQLSMKFEILINIEIAKIDGMFRFYSLKPAIILLINVKMPIVVDILTFMSRINFMFS